MDASQPTAVQGADAPDPSVEEFVEAVAGTETFWRSVPAVGDLPTLYVHGVPEHADQWAPFIARTGGVALDLPGFGRSEKSRFFDYSIGGYNEYLQAFIEHLGWDRFNLVVHDWGGQAVVTAQELHERIGKLVVINAVPLLPGYRWHRIARGWRTPVLGEVMMGLTTKLLLKQIGKESRPSGEPWPQEMIDSIWEYFDHGTQRAILKLYRSAPPRTLEQAGERLSLLTAPSLVLWGDKDPYIDTDLARDYAKALPNSRLEVLPDAGHWPWLDRPDAIETVAEFLGGDPKAER